MPGGVDVSYTVPAYQPPVLHPQSPSYLLPVGTPLTSRRFGPFFRSIPSIQLASETLFARCQLLHGWRGYYHSNTCLIIFFMASELKCQPLYVYLGLVPLLEMAMLRRKTPSPYNILYIIYGIYLVKQKWFMWYQRTRKHFWLVIARNINRIQKVIINFLKPKKNEIKYFKKIIYSIVSRHSTLTHPFHIKRDILGQSFIRLQNGCDMFY